MGSIVLSALLTAFQFAPPPGARPETPDAVTESATLSGVVTRVGTGEPLARAVVELRPTGTAQVPANPGREALHATTDGGGRFSLDGIPPGDYVITAYRNGYVREILGNQEDDPRAIPAPVGLAAGEEREVAFEMSPAGTITGRVYDRFGEPVVGAQVEALRPVSMFDGQQRLAGTQRAMTDDRGQYRLFWLDPDTYYVRASSQSGGLSVLVSGTGPNAAPSTGAPATAFFPGVPDETQAVAVTVNAGDELAGIDIRVEPMGGYSIRGRVVTRDLPPNQIQSISLSLLPTVPVGGFVPSIPGRSVDAEGNFEVTNVSPGSYNLRATVVLAGRPGPRAGMTVTVNNRDLEDIVLTIGPGIDFLGRVFVEDPASPNAAADSIDPSQLRLSLSTPGVPISTTAAATETTGEFEFESVQPGEYRLNVSRAPLGDGEFYVKRIRFNGEEVPVGAPIVVGDAVAEGLDVLLSPNGATVSGIVSDAEDRVLPGTMITLVPEGETLESANPLRRRTTTADSNGRYSLSGVAPGSYRLQVLPMTPTGVLPPAGEGEPVSVSEGESVTVNLEVEAASEDP